MKVKVTTPVGCPQTLQISSDANNMHMLFLGQSGSGKTTALRIISRNIAADGGRVLMFSFNGTQDTFQEDEQVQRISVRKDGLPFQPLAPLRRKDGKAEEENDVIEAFVGALSTAFHLQVRQQMTLRKAVRRVMHRPGTGDIFRRVGQELEADEKDVVAMSTLGRLYRILSQARVAADADAEFAICPYRITILDFGGWDRVTQAALVELVLALLWRSVVFYGPEAGEPLYVVLDEFQGIDFRRDSVLAQLLREGRKFGLSLLLATQTLETFSREQAALLQQAATRLYFRPAPRDIPGILAMLGTGDLRAFEELLRSLRSGECLADGRFELEGRIIERPIKVSFWIGERRESRAR